MKINEKQFREILTTLNIRITYINITNKINGFVYRYRNHINIFVNKKLSSNITKKLIINLIKEELKSIDKNLFSINIESFENEIIEYVEMEVKE